MKKIIRMLLIVTAMLLLAVPVSAKPSRKTVVKKYDQWRQKYVYNKNKYSNPKTYLWDINKDGVLEMIFQYGNGKSSGFRVYTYKNGKIVLVQKLTGVKRFWGVQGKKYLVVDQDNNFKSGNYTVYKMDGTKMKRICIYRLTRCVVENGKPTTSYTRNGKRILETRFARFMRTVTEPTFSSFAY